MEEIEKKEEIIEETPTEETLPEEEKPEETPEETEEQPEEKDIDYKKELETLESKKPKNELEKAKKALYFNSERLKELGGDPAEILGIKESVKETTDVSSVIKREFAERDARARASNDEEYKLIMWYVDNRNLDVEEAYILANKGKLQRSILEAKRGNPVYGKAFGGTKKETPVIANHPGADILARRGYKFNPQTKTYQAKYYEEYYDSTTKSWKSRKIQK